MEQLPPQVGSRVRVRRDPDFGPGPWPDQPTGTVIVSPEGNASDPVETTTGVRRLFWIAFDEPQFDVEGNGPFRSSQVLDKYLEFLSN
jgi:hypothetical protein